MEEEVNERKQFIDEMSKIGISRKMKEEIEGEITDKLREMKLLRRDREKQIEILEKIKDKNPSDSLGDNYVWSLTAIINQYTSTYIIFIKSLLLFFPLYVCIFLQIDVVEIVEGNYGVTQQINFDLPLKLISWRGSFLKLSVHQMK